jgi:hypothetical protein
MLKARYGDKYDPNHRRNKEHRRDSHSSHDRQRSTTMTDIAVKAETEITIPTDEQMFIRKINNLAIDKHTQYKNVVCKQSMTMQTRQ